MALAAGILAAVPNFASCTPEQKPSEEQKDPDGGGDEPGPEPEKPYFGIKTAADLVAFADSVNNGHSLTRFLRNGKPTLIADIDMSEVTEWTPIGNGTPVNSTSTCSYTGASFKGEFDGAGHCIYNFKAGATLGAGSTFGLFGILDQAVVSNLTMGKEGDQSEFKVSATGTADAGVIAGTVYCSTIQKCVNNIPVKVEGTTAAARFSVGAAAGYIFSDKAGISNITEVVNNAAINAVSGSNTANGATGVMVGGIVGFCSGSTEAVEVNLIENCENKGAIVATVGRASGIAATLNSTTMMRYCNNRGNITVDFVNGRIGALTCIMGSRCSMDESYNHADVITSDPQTTTAGMVALLNATDVVVTDGGNYGKIIGANETYHGLLCANFSKFSKVDGCFAGGSCWTYSADGKHVQHEINASNLYSHLGAQATTNTSKIVNIGSPYGEGGGDTPTPPDVEGKVTLKDASLKVLFIGNSFTDDAVKYLPQVLKGSGVTDYTVAQLYYGGRTMPEYASKFDTAEYTLYKAEAGAGTWTTHGSKVSIAQVAAGGRWDIVTFQEHTGNRLGWSWTDEEKNAIQAMFDKVNATQEKKPDYYWILSQAYFNMSKIGSASQPYMTWPKENTKAAQKQMYDVIVAQGKKVMETFPFKGIIATGTMLQNLRTTALNTNGWDQTRDGYHMEHGTARYGAALTVMETVISPVKGIKADNCNYRQAASSYTTVEGSVLTPVTDDVFPVVLQAARNAIAKPFEITDMSTIKIPGYNEDKEEVKLDGSGTQSDPYLIKSADQMAGVGANIAAGETKYFKLTADIDMSSITNWEPSLTKDNGAVIYFDGGGHTITGFRCDGKAYSSLFGVVHGGVSNLKLKNCTVSNQGICALLACVCGNTSHHVVISGVSATGCSVSQNNSSAQAECGGLVASAANTNINNCSYSGNLKNQYNGRTGGILGAVTGDVLVEKCWADVQLYVAKSTSGSGVGGIVGGPTADKSLTVMNCYTKGAFTGPGGYLGGVVGELASNGLVKNCYSTMDIVGDYTLGGITGRLANIKNPNSSNTWQTDINDTVEGCIAWMSSIKTNHSTGRIPTTGYSSGAVVAFTVYKNTLKNNWRKPGMTFNVYAAAYSQYNTVFDQDDCGPSNPYVKKGEETYYMPYHGKAAAAGETLTDVAKRIGWDSTIWDFSGSEPKLK